MIVQSGTRVRPSAPQAVQCGDGGENLPVNRGISLKIGGAGAGPYPRLAATQYGLRKGARARSNAPHSTGRFFALISAHVARFRTRRPIFPSDLPGARPAAGGADRIGKSTTSARWRRQCALARAAHPASSRWGFGRVPLARSPLRSVGPTLAIGNDARRGEAPERP